VHTSSKRELEQPNKKSSQLKEMHWYILHCDECICFAENNFLSSLYPGDLYPFTRRPLFLVIDSDNSFVFQHMPRYFGQPLVILMSPQDIPAPFIGIVQLIQDPNHCQPIKESIADHQHNGNLFTLFLHSPLTAFCYICNIMTVPIHLWERCQTFIDRFVTEASRLFTRCRIG
jgi:Protein SCAI